MDNIEAKFDLWKKKQLEKDTLMEAVWIHYHPRIQTYVQNFLSYGADVSDIASEILLRIFEKLSTYKRSYAFSTWVYSVARHFLLDYLRKNNQSREILDDQVVSEEPSPEMVCQYNNEVFLIRRAVRELNPKDRELIFLCFYEGLKYSEISRITGIPEGTIKYRMSECRKKLRIKLERSLVV